MDEFLLEDFQGIFWQVAKSGGSGDRSDRGREEDISSSFIGEGMERQSSGRYTRRGDLRNIFAGSRKWRRAAQGPISFLKAI